jgi:hypothetical protein
MTTRTLRLVLIAGVLAIGAATLIITMRALKEPSGQHVTISGNYSDDWMKECGPTQGTAQKTCTATLDAAYGRADGKPVPPATKGE